MMKRNCKRLALIGIASGFMLAIQMQAHATFSDEHSVLGSYDMLAALSWTCRSGGCGHRSGPSEHSHGSYQGSEVRQESVNVTTDYDTVDPNAFYKQLDTEGRRLYDSLNNDGKQLAVRLSKQYVNKNQAVREAVKQMELPNTQADY
ncbi:MAG: hypothetical protein ACE5GN_01080 [Waddliaceae bacterium]